MKRIPIAGPWITQHEIDYVQDAVAHGWYDKAGDYVDRFEKAFAAWVGVGHAVTTPSCTSAIHLALAAAGIGPGDEVVVPELTWIASAAPIDYVGATAVFADADACTWCVNPETVGVVLSERTRAVITVDLYGNVAPSREIAALRDDLFVIEDAAEAVGSTRDGARAGSLGAVGVFSFHGSKTLTTGEGGMLVTDDPRLHERCLFLRDHGRAPGDKSFFNQEVAFKYRMSNLQAALGLAQLERVDELVARKREIFGWYRELLVDVPVTLNQEEEGVASSFWMVTALLEAGVDRDRVMARLGESGIDTRPFFHPLSSLPALQDRGEAVRARVRNSFAYELAPRGLNLPSAASLTPEQVERVCVALREALES